MQSGPKPNRSTYLESYIRGFFEFISQRRDLLYFSGMSIIFYYLDFSTLTVLSCEKKITFSLVLHIIICSPSVDP